MQSIASLSLDLDNKWSYMKTHGDRGWESFPSYLDVVVPRALDFLKQRDLTITFFIVGQDAALDKNRDAIASIAAAGHEIGSHSFNHEPWLHLYSEQQIEAELAFAEEHIERVTGQRPVGFRGPGFSLSRSTLNVLARRGYEYDATTFPTFLGPLARAYYFMTTRLSRDEMKKRKLLFGAFGEGLRPVKPYRWELGFKALVEIPVTTVPYLKLPFHISYILYLGSFSTALAVNYFRMALWICRSAGVQPSLLLHPLDFLGRDDDTGLMFFPAMKIPSDKKLRLVSDLLAAYAAEFNVVPLREHARRVAEDSRARLVPPVFREQALVDATSS